MTDIRAASTPDGPGLMAPPDGTTPQPLGPELTSILAQSHEGFLHHLQVRLGGRDEAEDVLQDFYLRVVIKAGQIRDAESVMAWLRTVLKSVLVDYCRRRSAARKAQQAVIVDLLATTATQEDDFDRTTCTCFYRFLPTQKPEYAEVLRRVDVAGQSRHEAALALGITTGNVRVRLHRARRALKRSLELSCRECRSRGCFESRGAPSPRGEGDRCNGPAHCNASEPSPSYQ